MMDKVWRVKVYMVLAVGLGLLSIFTFTMPALSADLNTKGEGGDCGVAYGSVTKIHVKSATPEKVVYEFEGTYYYYPIGTAACPQGLRNTSGTGEWLKGQGTAVEEIKTPYGGGTPLKTTSKCSQNPWTTQNVQCTLVQKTPANWAWPTGPFPISATLTTDPQRQALKQEEQMKTIFTTPSAPVIESPPSNKVFLANVKIPLKVQHNPTWPPVFEYGWRSKAPKPGESPEAYQSVEGVVPQNLKTSAGTTTGELPIGKTGQWRIRAQCNVPGAPWSEWREFVVAPQRVADLTATKAPAAAQASPAAPSNLVATPLPQRKVKLEWQDKSNNEDKFIIERKDPGKAYQKKAEVGKDVKTWTDEDKLLLPNQTYYYRVKANNKYGESPSNEASAKPKIN